MPVTHTCTQNLLFSLLLVKPFDKQFSRVKSKEVKKIKAGVTTGPEHHQS